MKRKEVFPDFLMPGAQKCGTTSLHAWLGRHPEILMSDPKSPDFLEDDEEYEKGLDFYWEKYFNKWQGEKLLGESNIRNLYHYYVPERIFSINPEARFLIPVRNPVDRALSHWWMYYRRGWEQLSFEDGITADYERIRNGVDFRDPERRANYEREFHPRASGVCKVFRTYLDCGYYAQQMEYYLKFFPAERLKVLMFEDICERPEAVMREVCEFLGADPEECGGLDHSPENPARPMRWRRALSTNGRLLLKNIFSKDDRASVVKGLSGIRKSPAMGLETRRWLVEHFKPHNKRLEEIIGKKLDHWV
ncbi:MAG: sulfotransferase [Thermodesulfobacteriota bacterium]